MLLHTSTERQRYCPVPCGGLSSDSAFLEGRKWAQSLACRIVSISGCGRKGLSATVGACARCCPEAEGCGGRTPTHRKALLEALPPLPSASPPTLELTRHVSLPLCKMGMIITIKPACQDCRVKQANRCENAASTPGPVQIWLILPQAPHQL